MAYGLKASSCDPLIDRCMYSSYYNKFDTRESHESAYRLCFCCESEDTHQEPQEVVVGECQVAGYGRKDVLPVVFQSERPEDTGQR